MFSNGHTPLGALIRAWIADLIRIKDNIIGVIQRRVEQQNQEVTDTRADVVGVGMTVYRRNLCSKSGLRFAVP